MFNRKEVKAKGKELFKKFYWPSVLAAIVMAVGNGANSSSSGRSASQKMQENGSDAGEIIDALLSNPAIIVGIVVGVLIAIVAGLIVKALFLNHLKIGATKFYLNIQEGDGAVNALVFAFKEGRYKNIAITMFLQDLYITLWSLLFVIPGIIKSYEYRMIPYILADDPTISREEAFRKSKEMMMGNKWAAFVYDLSFIGWFILAICCTCGILAVFYVNPYYYASNAVLYTTLKGNSATAAPSYVEY